MIVNNVQNKNTSCGRPSSWWHQLPALLVTGASGFVGRALCAELSNQGAAFIQVMRTMPSGEFAHSLNPVIKTMAVGNIDGETQWKSSLDELIKLQKNEQKSCIIHLAAHVHQMNATQKDDAKYTIINVDGTLNLARQAAQMGIKRFVFLSSIKAMGEARGEPYTEMDGLNPQDAYGRSKRDAEEGLRKIGQETGLEVVILRPPLIYGHGVGANFLQLLKLVKSGLPLPLKSIDNQRSLLYVGNLVDALLLCTHQPKAANQTFLISDGGGVGGKLGVSTPELFSAAANAMSCPVRLFEFPIGLLGLAAMLGGKLAQFSRLTESLVVDSTRIQTELGWMPPFTLQDGLAQTVQTK